MKKPASKWTGLRPPTTSLHLEAVGMIAMEWAWLEIIIEMAIWRLLRVRGPIGTAVTRHIAPRVRLDILLSLADLKMNEQDREQLARLIDRINKLTGPRNDLIHAEWTGVKKDTWPPVARFHKRMARGHVIRHDHEVTPNQITAVATDIFKLSTDLLFFFESAGVFRKLPQRKSTSPSWQYRSHPGSL